MMYTSIDARREVGELLQEGYNFTSIWIFLNDLVRGKAIEWQDELQILQEIADGKFGNIDCSIETF